MRNAKQHLLIGLTLIGLACCAVPAHAADLSGCWTGEWSSCTTGHHGPLQATFCQLDTGDYRVDFRGRFAKIVPFRYSVVLHVVAEHDDGRVELEGSTYLGRLVGTFWYSATATDCVFEATYRSCKDAGTFSLRKR